jgi:transposase
LAKGHTISEAAEMTSFGARWIEQLLARYNALGPPSLGDRRRGNGAPARVLKPELLERLRARLAWAPVGERPTAHGHHRFEWLYVTAFVSPVTGECFWYVSNGMSKPLFEALLRLFAEEAGAGRDRVIVLVLDNAGWHGEPGLAVPDGLRLVFLPPYSPELQPAETLWTLVDEPIVNRHIPTLDELERIISARCAALADRPAQIHAKAGFHWWPKIANPI